MGSNGSKPSYGSNATFNNGTKEQTKNNRKLISGQHRHPRKSAHLRIGNGCLLLLFLTGYIVYISTSWYWNRFIFHSNPNEETKKLSSVITSLPSFVQKQQRYPIIDNTTDPKAPEMKSDLKNNRSNNNDDENTTKYSNKSNDPRQDFNSSKSSSLGTRQQASYNSSQQVLIPTNETRSNKASSTTRTTKIFKRKSPNWYEPYLDNMTRIFPSWPKDDRYGWCLRADQTRGDLLYRGQMADGLVYVKSHKASSTTCEGINLSISHNVAKRKFASWNMTQNDTKITNTSQTESVAQSRKSPFVTPPVCVHYNRHEFADQRHHARKGSPSILWSFVRDPTRRDLSHFFHFQVGRLGVTPENNYMIKHIEHRIKGRQVRYLIPSKPSKQPLWPRHELHVSPQLVMDIIRDNIIHYYDFLGVTERMTESLAVMKVLWDLKPTDLIVLSSKRSGGYDDAGHENTCVPIPKAYVPSAQVQAYLDGPYRYFNGDLALYHAVNRSLDATIEHLGRHKIEKIANEIQYLQDLAELHCRSEAYFPCSETGQLQEEKAKENCYVQDSGCGYKCVDRIMDLFNQGHFSKT